MTQLYAVGEWVRVRSNPTRSQRVYAGQEFTVAEYVEHGNIDGYYLPADNSYLNGGIWQVNLEPVRLQVGDIVTFTDLCHQRFPFSTPEPGEERVIRSSMNGESYQIEQNGQMFFRDELVFVARPLPGNVGTQHTVTKNKERGAMSIAAETRGLVRWYVENTLNLNYDEVLLNARLAAEVGADARRIKRDFRRWLESMTLIERFEVEGGIRVVKAGERFEFSFTSSFSGNDYNLMGSLAPASVTVSSGIELVESVLPQWVRLRWSGSYIYMDVTRKHPAYERAIYMGMDRSASSVALYVNSAGKLATADVVNLYHRAERFGIEARGLVAQAMKDSRPDDTRVSNPSRSGTGDFEAFLHERHMTTRSDDRFVECLPVLPHGLKSSRPWGIEVETAGARGVKTPAGWQNKYDGSLESAYAEHGQPNDDGEWCDTCGYNHDDDGNITSDDCREFVSPVLHSYHSKGLEALVGEIITQPQNDTAGIHVHVDVADLSARQIGSLVYGYSVIEPLLVSSYQRTNREYCKERPTRELMEALKSAKHAAVEYAHYGEHEDDYGKTIGDKSHIEPGDRYVSLNLHSLKAHGTVEFRALGPVYDYEYIIRWAHLVRELVNVAKNGAKLTDWNAVKDFKSLQRLLRRYGSETADTTMSEITKEDMDAMVERNRNFRVAVPANEVELVGGEV